MKAYRQVWATVIVIVALPLFAAGCSGDDGGSDAPDAGDSGAPDDAADSGDDGDADDGGDDATTDTGGGPVGGGTLVVDGVAIVLDRSQCFLEEQDASAGGGKILFRVQGSGTDATGGNVTLDVFRYDEDSEYTGDEIVVDDGDFTTGGALRANAELGTVNVDGSTFSADNLTFVNLDDLSEQTGSFVLDC